jgi:hypothetical protein
MFNPMTSFLRHFNGNTNFYSYRTALIGPFLNYLGRMFNFLNQQDCEVLSDFRDRKKWRAHGRFARFKAIVKLIPSSVGAIVRGLATVVDQSLYSLIHPISTFKRIFGIGSKRSFAQRMREPFEVRGPKKDLPFIQHGDKISLKTLTLNVGMLRKEFWAFKKDFNELRPPQERVMELIEKIKSSLADNDVICLQEAFEPSVTKISHYPTVA